MDLLVGFTTDVPIDDVLLCWIHNRNEAGFIITESWFKVM